jgi:GNAT superfamily N-acetyltransferase
VSECERVQAAWLVTRAHALGGESWEEGGLRWALEPSAASLLFPARIDPSGVARGMRRLPRGITVGAWLGRDVDAAPLYRAGFRRGWSPWWMVARLDQVGSCDDPRIQLKETSDDYGGEHASYARNLALARLRPKQVWYAAAYTGSPSRFAGHAWSYLSDDGLAGVFDMAVWPRFRRRGLGTALLRTVCTAAGEAGADRAVLNATPEGKHLYETCGFTQAGEGITWWHPGVSR